MTAGECKWLARLGRLPPLRRRLRARSRHCARVMSGPRRLLPDRRAEPRRRPRHCPGAAVSPVPGSHPGTIPNPEPLWCRSCSRPGSPPPGIHGLSLKEGSPLPSSEGGTTAPAPQPFRSCSTRRTPRHLQDPASLIPGLSSSRWKLRQALCIGKSGIYREPSFFGPEKKKGSLLCKKSHLVTTPHGGQN